MSHDIGMLHVYGYRRQGGPFFIDNPRTADGQPEKVYVYLCFKNGFFTFRKSTGLVEGL